jgi:hypothetical protein
MIDSPAPFIVGVPRSGTTLLRLQLDAHPELAIPPETGFGTVSAAFAGHRASPDELLDALAALPTWPDLGLDRQALGRPSGVGDALRACYRAYADRHDKPRWGDKTPGHARLMETLAHDLPEARFIHLIRDGRDVAASLRGLPFAPGDGSVRAIAADWRDTIAATRRAGERLQHYVEVRYEHLVSEPEAALREVCEFLHLSFHPAMLRAHERAPERLAELRSARVYEDGSVQLAGGVTIASRTAQPPDPSRIGRWRQTLSEHDLAVFEQLAGGALAADGYAPSYAPPGRRRMRDRSTPMRIVVGTRSLVAPGGTETSAITVARELERLGHDVTLTAEELGPLAEEAKRSGLRVATLAELPPRCDAIVAHDATMTAVLAERQPDARVVFVAHSDFFDPQLPVQVPGVVDAVVACSDRLAARIRALALDVPIVRLREPIATDRFASAAPLPPRPRRVLILSNYLHGDRRRALIDAWSRAHVEFVEIGGTSATTLDPRPAMEDADVVVAKARAALEAMSVGRAVYLYDQFGGDGWITPDSYPAMEADNFAGQAAPAPRTAADLEADLARYHPDMGRVNSELVRTHHGARRHANELVAVLRGPHERREEATAVLAEVARLTRATWQAEHRTVAREHELWTLRERTAAAEADALASRERAASLERQLDETRALLGTRRVRAGLAVGRAADAVRGRT